MPLAGGDPSCAIEAHKIVFVWYVHVVHVCVFVCV